MKSASSFLCLLAIGCSSTPAVPTSPKIEPHSSGATLYVVDTWEDWLDDGMDMTNSFEDRGRTCYMGEQALRMVLQLVARGVKARLAFLKHFDLREDVASHVFVPEVVHYLAPAGEGMFTLQHSDTLGGFDLQVTPHLQGNRSLIALDCGLKKICPIRAKIPGTGFEGGEPTFSHLWIESHTRIIPLGATLLFEAPRGDGRSTVLLLHVATIAETDEVALRNCIERLIQDPADPDARSHLPDLLRVADDETMREMRAHHGTGETMMRHYYPSHLWIQPFLRGCRLMREGEFARAESEFESSRAAALEGSPSNLAVVVSKEALLRLAELRKPR
jgi:hypothetical protein